MLHRNTANFAQPAQVSTADRDSIFDGMRLSPHWPWHTETASGRSCAQSGAALGLGEVKGLMRWRGGSRLRPRLLQEQAMSSASIPRGAFDRHRREGQA